jgi:hypothetical protein
LVAGRNFSEFNNLADRKVGRTTCASLDKIASIGKFLEEKRVFKGALSTKSVGKSNWRREGIRTPYEAPDSLGKTGKHTEKDTEISVIPGHDLSRIVSVWAKLPYPLKAAILAIVGTVDASPEVKR